MQFSKSPIIFYFGPNKIDMYCSEMKQVISWALADDVYRDLEIVDAVKFRKLMVDAVASQKIKPDQVIVILSEHILFATELPNGSHKEADKVAMLRRFRLQVPFPSPFVKEITKDKSTIAVALNRDLYDLLIDQFKGLEFDVTTLVPSQLLPFAMPASGMTVSEAQAIIQYWPRLEAQDFLEAEKHKTQFISASTAQTAEDKRRTLILSSIFGILLVVLVLVAFFMINQNNKERARFEQEQAEAIAALSRSVSQVQQEIETTTQPTSQRNQATESAVATESAEASGTSIESDQPNRELLESLSVVVSQPENSSITTEEVLEVLETLGAQDVTVVESAEVAPSLLTINTGDAVTAAQRTSIRQTFEAGNFEVSVRRVSDMDSDVLVVLPR